MQRITLSYICRISALLFFLSGINASGQQAVTSAAVSVRVVDATGGVVPGVLITVSNTDLNQNWKAMGDEQGRQRFSLLPLGSYEVIVEKDGFAPFNAKFILGVGQSLE